MASIEKRERDGVIVYRVHYRMPAGAQRNKTFERRADARRFLANVEAAKDAGTYVDPARARLTVGEWAEKWLAGQSHLKPSSYERAAGIVRTYIPADLGRCSAFAGLARRGPVLGHEAGGQPVALDGSEDPPHPVADPRPGGPGRAAG
jgi:hypothetical protein